MNSSKNVTCFIIRFVINHFPNWKRREMQTFSSGVPRIFLSLWSFLLVENVGNHCAELDRIVINIFFLSFFLFHSDLFYLLVGVEGYFGTWSHSDTSHSVGLLWTSDQPDAETSTCQHTAIKRETHPYPGRIRSRNPNNHSSADLHLRPRGHWYRSNYYLTPQNN